MERCTRCIPIVVVALFFASTVPLRAQDQNSALTAKEVDQLRDSAYFPDQRVLVYIGFLNDRTSAIHDLFDKPRRPGREQDVHDLMQQFSFIADELEDNLVDAKEHRVDLRKVLPKLLAATERWATELKSPPDDDHYSIVRKLTLDAVRDLHDDATDILAQQKSNPPPPARKPDNRAPDAYTIPDPR